MTEGDRNFHRSERLMRIKEFLSGNNLTTRELLLRLELNEDQLRSLQRDLKLLVVRNDIEKKSGGKYALKARKVSTLNPAEALAAYSAARLFFHHAPEYNKHYLRVLDELSSKLPERVRKITEQMASIYSKKSGTRMQSRSLEHCSIAWLDGHWLKFDYHAPSPAPAAPWNSPFTSLKSTPTTGPLTPSATTATPAGPGCGCSKSHA